jgi:predicted acyl esterase
MSAKRTGLVFVASEGDGAVHAYLEDVPPTGRVTYLDEGVIRLIDRKEVDPRSSKGRRTHESRRD